MYIVPIAWLYVTLMMAVAEATNSNGSVLGALITFVLYGVLPVTLVVYLMRSPARRRAIRAREAQESVEGGAAVEASRAIPVEDRAPLRSGLSRNVSEEDRAPLRSDLSRKVSEEDRATLRSDLSRKVSGGDPDTSRHAAAATQGEGVAPVREET